MWKNELAQSTTECSDMRPARISPQRPTQKLRNRFYMTAWLVCFTAEGSGLTLWLKNTLDTALLRSTKPQVVERRFQVQMRDQSAADGQLAAAAAR